MIKIKMNAANAHPEQRRLTDAKQYVCHILKEKPHTITIEADSDNTIDDFYHQAMVTTKAICLFYGVDHLDVSKTIIDAYNNGLLKYKSEECKEGEPIFIEAEEFITNIYKSFERIFKNKPHGDLEDSKRLVGDLFQNASVQYRTIPQHDSGDQSIPTIPIDTPEHLVRTGRHYETLYSKKYLEEIPDAVKTTLEKLIFPVAHHFDFESLKNKYHTTYCGRHHPLASETVSKKFGLKKLSFDNLGDLTGPQFMELFGWMTGGYNNEVPLEEAFIKPGRDVKESVLAQTETFKIRETFYHSLPKLVKPITKDYDNIAVRFGSQHRTKSEDDFSVILDDKLEEYARSSQSERKRKIRPVDYSDQIMDYDSAIHEAWSKGYPIDKTPSGNCFMYLTHPFMLAEDNPDFEFTKDDFVNLYKLVGTTCILSGGHSEQDMSLSIKYVHKIITESYEKIKDNPEKQAASRAYKQLMNNFLDAFSCESSEKNDPAFNRKILFDDNAMNLSAWNDANYINEIE